MRFFRFGPIFLVLTLSLSAVPVEQSLGRNLVYWRARELPADLPKMSAAPKGTLVLDLRFARAAENDVAVFAAWLKFSARPQSPVLVLVNDRTDRLLLAALAPAEKPAGVVSIGPAKEGATWDVPVKVDPEADRAAYDLFERGTPLDQLIVRKMEKIRRDEAAMAKNWTGEAPDDEGTEEPGAPPSTAKPESNPPAAEPPLDLVLQRAVQLHRALLALKKISAG